MVFSSYDGQQFLMTDYLSWWWNGKHYRNIIGASTDLASTPKIGWNVLPPGGWYARAAAAHDFAYRCELEVETNPDVWLRIQMPFDDANQMILDLMTSLQTSPFQEGEKMLIYEAVSKAGQTAYIDDLAKPIVMPPPPPA